MFLHIGKHNSAHAASELDLQQLVTLPSYVVATVYNAELKMLTWFSSDAIDAVHTQCVLFMSSICTQLMVCEHSYAV